MAHLLTIDNENELYALWIALLEVKFHPDPETPELQGSPFIAKLAKEVTEALIAFEESRYNSGKAEWYREAVKNGERFLNVIPVVMKNLQDVPDEVWNKWTNEERENCLETLLSPYTINEDLFDDLIENKGKIKWVGQPVTLQN